MMKDNVFALQASPIPWYENDFEYGLVLHKQERETTTDAWDTSRETYGTSYKVWATSLLWGSDLFVYGETDGGDSVIEQWALPQQEGGRAVTAVIASTPLGVPGPTSSASTSLIVGGVYVPLVQRGAVGRVRRTELYRGTMPSVWHATFDLDGRFVMFLGGDLPGLYSVATNQSNPSPTVLMTPAQLPELQYADTICVLHHVHNGRCYVLELTGVPPGMDDGVILWDYDNDGIPDGHVTFPNDQFDTLFPDSDWDDSQIPWLQEGL